MENSVLQTNNENPYLGVHLEKHLNWAAHVNQITSKANQTLGFVRRNLKRAQKPIKEQAYTSLVRPKLEYASPIWSPHQDYLKAQLEGVQKKAARFVLNRPHKRHDPSSCTENATSMVKEVG